MRYLLILFIGFFSTILFCQKDYFHQFNFTEADTLRGMLRPERTCFDVTFYDLNIQVYIENKHIKGYVDIYFDAIEDFNSLQIDLFENMTLQEVLHEEDTLAFRRNGNVVFIDFDKVMLKDSSHFIRMFYEGSPIIARRAPWDGGFVWSKDQKGNPWVAVACEGTGASLWWPNKDHLSDEPDSMRIKVRVPDNLTCVSNGNLIESRKSGNGETEWHWFVSYPINNYNVSINIADYAHFSNKYTAQDGEVLECDYYVLKENLKKAKKQFAQVNDVLAAYEHYFGKYPFWNDGLAFVETPYLGMEHQSAIAYGNQYKRGYLGGMIPLDMDWDYIIVHELGHEWWGNSISINDHAEMWIHESFTTYMESLFVEYQFGYDDAVRYLAGQKSMIENKLPMLGPLHVNFGAWGTSDHYYKGAWMLHTLRHAINDDKKWWGILKDFYQKNKISNVTSSDFIDYVNQVTRQNWTPFFIQYLKQPHLPVLQYRTTKVGKDVFLAFQWKAVAGFEMPVKVKIGEEEQMISPSSGKLQQVRLKNARDKQIEFRTDLFLIEIENLKK